MHWLASVSAAMRRGAALPQRESPTGRQTDFGPRTASELEDMQLEDLAEAISQASCCVI